MSLVSWSAAQNHSAFLRPIASAEDQIAFVCPDNWVLRDQRPSEPVCQHWQQTSW